MTQGERVMKARRDGGGRRRRYVCKGGGGGVSGGLNQIREQKNIVKVGKF